MPKELQIVVLHIVGTPNPDGTWAITAKADLIVGLSEYPEWDKRRKSMPIIMSNPQEQPIRSFFTTVVLPQAEAAK